MKILRAVILGAGVAASCAAPERTSILPASPPSQRVPAPTSTTQPLPSPSKTLTLTGAYRHALQQSDSVALSAEQLAQVQARYEQALRSILPDLRFKGSYLRQDDSGVSSSGSTQGSFTQKERTEYRFNARQPLFGGLREYHTQRQMLSLRAAAEQRLEHARRMLFLDVAEAFHAVTQSLRDLASARDHLRLAEDRLAELQARQRLQMVRTSEVLAQQAETASARARLTALEGIHEIAWEAFRFITGIATRPALAEDDATPGSLKTVEHYLALIDERSDLNAARQDALAAEAGINIAEAGYYPTLSLEGNYFTHREGASEDIDWDVMLLGEIPLSGAGVTGARVREAESQRVAAHLQYRRLRRETELAVRTAHSEATAFASQLHSQEEAMNSATEHYALAQAEYRTGLMTNTEVLASFVTLQKVTVERDRTQVQAQLARIRLWVESGRLPEGVFP